MLASTGVYAIATFVGRMASFLLFPVYTRFLSPSDYGVLELLELTLYAWGTLLGMRIGDSLMYRWPACTTAEERSAVLGSSYWGACLLGLLSLTVGWPLSKWLSVLVFGTEAYSRAFVLMFSSFGLSLPWEVVLAFTRIRDKPVHYLYFSVARLVMSASLNIYLLAARGWGYEAMLWGNLVSAGVLTVCAGGYIALTGYRWTAFRVAEWRRLLVYGAPLGAGGLAQLVIHYGDRFFLRQYATLADIGIYALAYKLGMLVANLQVPFETYWRAQVFQIIRRPDGELIYVRVCTYLTLALTTFLVLLFGYSVPVLNIMAGAEFRVAAQYVPIIALAYIIRALAAHFRTMFLIEGKTIREVVVSWLGMGVCLGGYAVLIPRMTLWGAVLATLLAFSVMFVVGLWQAQRMRRVPYEYGRMMKVAAAATPAALLCWWYKPGGLVAQFALGTAAVLIYGGLLWMMGFLTAEERAKVKQAAAWLRRR
jgi:O-antigen/teichoic acid export membrane protein